MIDLPINLGLAGAFQTGLKYAYLKGYKYAIQFDADGQHRPEFIENMLQKIKEGYDIVIGSRFVEERKSHSFRMLGSRMLTTKVRVSDPTSGMRMFSANMIREFAQNLNYGPEPDTISYLIKNGAKVSEVSVKMDEREFGESYLNVVGAAKYRISEREDKNVSIIKNTINCRCYHNDGFYVKTYTLCKVKNRIFHILDGIFKYFSFNGNFPRTIVRDIW